MKIEVTDRGDSYDRDRRVLAETQIDGRVYAGQGKNLFSALQHLDRVLKDHGAPVPGGRVKCEHKDLGDGPRVPLRHGSAATKVCLMCGMWADPRDAANPNDPRKYRWRKAEQLLVYIAEGNDE